MEVDELLEEESISKEEALDKYGRRLIEEMKS